MYKIVFLKDNGDTIFNKILLGKGPVEHYSIFCSKTSKIDDEIWKANQAAKDFRLALQQYTTALQLLNSQFALCCRMRKMSSG